MNWNEELLKKGFVLLESSTRTYGNSKFTGSIVIEKKGEIMDEKDIVKTKDAKEVFSPFIHADDPKSPNRNYQTVRLRNEEDLDKYINADMVKLVDTQSSNL